ncbi:MAG: hypothetical protein V7606_125 [Burkholderiales bacterium]
MERENGRPLDVGLRTRSNKLCIFAVVAGCTARKELFPCPLIDFLWTAAGPGAAAPCTAIHPGIPAGAYRPAGAAFSARYPRVRAGADRLGGAFGSACAGTSCSTWHAGTAECGWPGWSRWSWRARRSGWPRWPRRSSRYGRSVAASRRWHAHIAGWAGSGGWFGHGRAAARSRIPCGAFGRRCATVGIVILRKCRTRRSQKKNGNC